MDEAPGSPEIDAVMIAAKALAQTSHEDLFGPYYELLNFLEKHTGARYPYDKVIVRAEFPSATPREVTID